MNDLFVTFSGAVGLLVVSACVFYHGLRRYESGNLISMNG